MNKQGNYYQWRILENSTIQSKRLELSDMVIHAYQGMTKPEQLSDTEFKVKVTIKYYWKFTNGWIMIDSITHATVDSDVRRPLFKEGVDENSVEALCFLMKQIHDQIDLYAEKYCPDLKGHVRKLSNTELMECSQKLLRSKFELEN